MNDAPSSRTYRADPSHWMDEYGDYLFRFAMSRLRDRNSAEDVVQETLVSALKNVGQFQGQSSEQAWLVGILKNKIVDVYRRKGREPAGFGGDSADISERLFDQHGSWKKEIRAAIRYSLDSLDRTEFWQVLKRCLSGLPSRQADVFTLRVMDEVTADEICKELDISSNNYWVILHRARLQLASCMKQRWFAENED